MMSNEQDEIRILRLENIASDNRERISRLESTVEIGLHNLGEKIDVLSFTLGARIDVVLKQVIDLQVHYEGSKDRINKIENTSALDERWKHRIQKFIIAVLGAGLALIIERLKSHGP